MLTLARRLFAKFARLLQCPDGHDEHLFGGTEAFVDEQVGSRGFPGPAAEVRSQADSQDQGAFSCRNCCSPARIPARRGGGRRLLPTLRTGSAEPRANVKTLSPGTRQQGCREAIPIATWPKPLRRLPWDSSTLQRPGYRTAIRRRDPALCTSWARRSEILAPLRHPIWSSTSSATSRSTSGVLQLRSRHSSDG